MTTPEWSIAEVLVIAGASFIVGIAVGCSLMAIWINGVISRSEREL